MAGLVLKYFWLTWWMGSRSGSLINLEFFFFLWRWDPNLKVDWEARSEVNLLHNALRFIVGQESYSHTPSTQMTAPGLLVDPVGKNSLSIWSPFRFFLFFLPFFSISKNRNITVFNIGRLFPVLICGPRIMIPIVFLSFIKVHCFLSFKRVALFY